MTCHNLFLLSLASTHRTCTKRRSQERSLHTDSEIFHYGGEKVTDGSWFRLWKYKLQVDVNVSIHTLYGLCSIKLESLAAIHCTLSARRATTVFTDFFSNMSIIFAFVLTVFSLFAATWTEHTMQSLISRFRRTYTPQSPNSRLMVFLLLRVFLAAKNIKQIKINEQRWKWSHSIFIRLRNTIEWGKFQFHKSEWLSYHHLHHVGKLKITFDDLRFTLEENSFIYSSNLSWWRWSHVKRTPRTLQKLMNLRFFSFLAA